MDRQEHRELLLKAALARDPSIYGPMTDEEQARYEALIREIEEVRWIIPDATFDIPCSY